MLARLVCIAPIAFAGCIFHTDPWDFDKERGESSLYVNPPDVYVSDGNAVLTVTDNYGEVDFREVWDVRSLGDFQLVEWSSNRDSVMLVVGIDDDAHGEQPIAIDLNNGSVFASFNAY